MTTDPLGGLLLRSWIATGVAVLALLVFGGIAAAVPWLMEPLGRSPLEHLDLAFDLMAVPFVLGLLVGGVAGLVALGYAGSASWRAIALQGVEASVRQRYVAMGIACFVGEGVLVLVAALLGLGGALSSGSLLVVGAGLSGLH